MKNNKAYTREYLEIVSSLEGDAEGKKAAFRHMSNSTCLWHGKPLPFSFVPRVFNEHSQNFLKDLALVSNGILEKTIRCFQENEDFRSYFRLDPRVKDLALLKRGYEPALVFPRLDFMWDEQTNKVQAIEFNGDAASGMLENFESLCALKKSSSFQEFAARHELSDDTKSTFEGLVQSFKKLYMQTEGAKEKPQLAIVVLFESENPNLGELERYMQLFEKAGILCSVFDARQLTYNGEELFGRTAYAGRSNVYIDCIWKYCVTVDLLRYWADVQDFLVAIRRRKVEIFGSFATQIAHDKQLFAVLKKPEVARILKLTQKEKRFVEDCIPDTFFLDDELVDIAEIKKNRAAWVLKPTDWYEGKHVVVGAFCSQKEWEHTIDSRLNTDFVSSFLLQKYAAPYVSAVIPISNEKDTKLASEPLDYGNMIGLYVHAGKFAGVYVRQGQIAPIGTAHGGLVAPVVWVHE